MGYVLYWRYSHTHRGRPELEHGIGTLNQKSHCTTLTDVAKGGRGEVGKSVGRNGMMEERIREVK